MGANIGYYTLLASKLVGAEGKVIAIEASPAIFKRLDENIMRNRTDNVELLNIAIDAKSGERDLFSAPAGNIGATSLIQGHGFRLEAHVKTDTLAAVISPDAVARLRLIKIDVEGAEAAVVAGLKPILQGCPDNMEILIEISPHLLRRQGLVPKDVIKVFSEHGFFPYSLKNDYSPEYYLMFDQPDRPIRHHGDVSEVMDFVFSRVDAPSL